MDMALEGQNRNVSWILDIPHLLRIFCANTTACVFQVFYMFIFFLSLFFSICVIVLSWEDVACS